MRDGTSDRCIDKRYGWYFSVAAAILREGGVAQAWVGFWEEVEDRVWQEYGKLEILEAHHGLEEVLGKGTGTYG